MTEGFDELNCTCLHDEEDHGPDGCNRPNCHCQATREVIRTS